MPTYDYYCETCDHRFEAFHSISAEPIKKCPNCGARVQRLIGGGTGLIFSGSGFYITDYKNGDKKKPEKSSNEPVKSD